MSQRTCLACDRPIDPLRRADAKVCPTPSCRVWVRRHPGEKKPPEGPITYVCQYERCGKTFTREKLHAGKRPRFCGDPCWESYRHYETRPEGYWRVENPYASRWYICTDCGGTGLDSGYGPVPTRCEECADDHSRESASQWQRDNKEQASARKMAWAVANPDRVAASLERTKERRYAAIKLYREQNPDRVREWKRNREARRRARKLGLPFEVFTSEEIFDRDNWVCRLCSETVDPLISWPNPFSASLDHRIPISKGGHHTRVNVQLAHLGCNARKGDRII